MKLNQKNMLGLAILLLANASVLHGSWREELGEAGSRIESKKSSGMSSMQKEANRLKDLRSKISNAQDDLAYFAQWRDELYGYLPNARSAAHREGLMHMIDYAEQKIGTTKRNLQDYQDQLRTEYSKYVIMPVELQ